MTPPACSGLSGPSFPNPPAHELAFEICWRKRGFCLHTRLFLIASHLFHQPSTTTKTLTALCNHFNLSTHNRDPLTTQHLQHAELRCPRSPHDWPRLLQLYVFFTRASSAPLCAIANASTDTCPQLARAIAARGFNPSFIDLTTDTLHHRRRRYPPGPRLPHQGQPHLLQLRWPGPSLSRVHQPPEGEVLLRMW